jgi:ubiquinone/menaquinone biosynthesis C-methylase UbiE
MAFIWDMLGHGTRVKEMSDGGRQLPTSALNHDAISDYRLSHIAKGADYDRCIEQDPLSQYMARREAYLLSRLAQKHFGGRIARYLDFACGTGRITSLMENKAERAYALDVSSSMVEIARTKCHTTTFLIGDLTREPLEFGEIDLITAFRFFGNAQQDLRKNVLVALRRKLASGGYLIFNNHRNPAALKSYLLRMSGASENVDLDIKKIRQLLRDTGFKIVRIYGIGAWVVCNRVAGNRSLLNSALARCLEHLSLLPGVARFCPDMIVVARRDIARGCGG